MTASADTREGPVEDLFSNFLDKSPDSLFRRLDTDYYYPTFGDDGVVEEMAPTQGKFYVKASRGENYGLWGNFAVGYLGNELAQVDRGLYGANVHYGSDSTTRFGERRLALDGFAAEPGTVASREDAHAFAVGLSPEETADYLRRQSVSDLLTAAERLDRRHPDARVARLVRDGVVVWEGPLGSLRRFKEDAKEVQAGMECGIGLQGFNDVKEQDVIECYEEKQVEATLE